MNLLEKQNINHQPYLIHNIIDSSKLDMEANPIVIGSNVAFMTLAFVASGSHEEVDSQGRITEKGRSDTPLSQKKGAVTP